MAHHFGSTIKIGAFGELRFFEYEEMNIRRLEMRLTVDEDGYRKTIACMNVTKPEATKIVDHLLGFINDFGEPWSDANGPAGFYFSSRQETVEPLTVDE